MLNRVNRHALTRLILQPYFFHEVTCHCNKLLLKSNLPNTGSRHSYQELTTTTLTPEQFTCISVSVRCWLHICHCQEHACPVQAKCDILRP